MTRHEWKERGEEGLCYFRATHHGGKWEIHTLPEGAEEWKREDPIPLAYLHALRDVLFRKYQRRRVPFEHVEQIDSMIESAQ